MAFAFVDDSGSGGDSPFYVLAGYCASETAWRAFWERWQGVLDLAPKLEYFKMSEAESLKGQFLGFTPQNRDARLDKFIDAILDHDLFEVSIAIRDLDYREILLPILPKSHASPYYSAFFAMVTAFSGVYRHSGSDETIHFIFDGQGDFEKRALRMYSDFKANFAHWQLGQVSFKNDKDCLPLQASDLVAWQTRRFMCSPEPTRAEIRKLHSLRKPFRSTLDRATLQNSAAAILENLPRMREEYGDERIDRFLTGIEKRNVRKGIGQPIVSSAGTDQE